MIEAVSEKNFSEVLPLIRQYQEFYNVPSISDSMNSEFFSQFGESNSLGCLFIYRKDEQAIAFATVYFSFASSIASKIAIMNDLYTVPQMRGLGIGKLLIEHCHTFAKSHGAARLQWTTAIDNTQAQKLYDSFPASKSSWLIYTYVT